MSTAKAEFVVPYTRHAHLLRTFGELIKVRVTSLILLTACCGAFLAAAKTGRSLLSLAALSSVLGVGFVAAGTAALNEVMEREIDAKMDRTCTRPLVTGAISVTWATAISIALVLAGILSVYSFANLLAAILTLLTALTYLGAYTPVKTRTPLCTLIGAFPGAMPALLGWVAVRGRVEWEAVVLFGIVFFWQFPHFHSIALLYREDYERAGVRMLPVVEPDGRSTALSILSHSVALIGVSLLPWAMGMTGFIYAISAGMLGLALLLTGLRFYREYISCTPARTKQLARQILTATVLYLPALFAVMVLNSHSVTR